MEINAPSFIELTSYATGKPILINLNHIIKVSSEKKQYQSPEIEMGCLTLTDKGVVTVLETYEQIKNMMVGEC